MDDNQLLRRCQQGERSALDELLRRYQERIYRLAYRVAGDAELAQEATAAALVKVWTKAGQWRSESSAGTWIYQLAYRTILDTQRRQRRWWMPRIAAAVADGRPTPDEIAAKQDEQEKREYKIQQALQQLSRNDRALIHLYYFEERSLTEIEEISGATRAALKMRLSRARRRLRELLEEFGDPQ